MTQEQEREFRAFGEDWLRCWADWSHQRPGELPIDIAVAVAGSIAYLQDLTKTYLLGPDDTWREV